MISNNISTPTGAQIARTTSETASWGADGFGFDDLLDILNPLQHVPIVSDLYRAVTGDVIQPAAQVMGGGVFGGIGGLVSSAAQLMIGESVTELAFGDNAESHETLPETPTAPGQVAGTTNLHQRDTEPAIVESDYPMTAHAKRMHARMAYWA